MMGKCVDKIDGSSNHHYKWTIIDGSKSNYHYSQNECRMTIKRKKSLAFNGDNLIEQITRAKIYFEVQNTMEGVRIKLAKSIESSTI